MTNGSNNKNNNYTENAKGYNKNCFLTQLCCKLPILPSSSVVCGRMNVTTQWPVPLGSSCSKTGSQKSVEAIGCRSFCLVGGKKRCPMPVTGECRSGRLVSWLCFTACCLQGHWTTVLMPVRPSHYTNNGNTHGSGQPPG